MFLASPREPGPSVGRRMVWHALAAAALCAASAVAHAREPRDEAAQVPIQTLKRDYLACHRASLRHALDSGEAMHCSVIYEALKHRAFGDDFERMLAWTRAQSRPHGAGAAAAQATPGASSCLADDL